MAPVVFVRLLGVFAVFTVFIVCEASPANEGDACRRLCESPLAAAYSRTECERGCRLFDIAMNTNKSPSRGIDLNATKEECHGSCRDAYGENARVHCFAGCAQMLNLLKDSWLVFERKGDGEGVMGFEINLVSDAVLREKTAGYDVFKLPQSFIRTLPIQPEDGQSYNTKMWSPCVPQSSGLPRWIVAVVAIVLTIFTLYVSFILPARPDICIEEAEVERRRRTDCEDYDSDDLRKELNYLYHKKEPTDDFVIDLDLMTLNEFLTEDYHANIVPPPKYTLLPVNEVRVA